MGSGPEFPWSICLSKTPSNINLVSLGAPAQSFLGGSALARLPLTLTWISLGAPAQSFPLLGAFAPAILLLTLTWISLGAPAQSFPFFLLKHLQCTLGYLLELQP